jgi:hypothetical protein
VQQLYCGVTEHDLISSIDSFLKTNWDSQTVVELLEFGKEEPIQEVQFYLLGIVTQITTRIPKQEIIILLKEHKIVDAVVTSVNALLSSSDNNDIYIVPCLHNLRVLLEYGKVIVLYY